jgi:hypothetical protein
LRGYELRAIGGAASDLNWLRRLGFARVLLGGDEGVDAIGGGAIESGVIAEFGRGNDDARFAASACALRNALHLRCFVLRGELVRMGDARVERRWKQGKAEERRGGVMGSSEAH